MTNGLVEETGGENGTRVAVNGAELTYLFGARVMRPSGGNGKGAAGIGPVGATGALAGSIDMNGAVVSPDCATGAGVMAPLVTTIS